MRRNGAPQPEPEPEMDMDNPLYAGGRQSMGGPPDAAFVFVSLFFETPPKTGCLRHHSRRAR